MADQVRHCPNRRRRQHEQNIAPGAEPARQRAAKRDQPSQVEPQMGQIGVDEGIGEKGPQVGGKTARKDSTQDGFAAIARRNKAEGQDELDVLPIAQEPTAHGMDADKHAEDSNDRSRNVEYRLSRTGLRLLTQVTPGGTNRLL